MRVALQTRQRGCTHADRRHRLQGVTRFLLSCALRPSLHYIFKFRRATLQMVNGDMPNTFCKLLTLSKLPSTPCQYLKFPIIALGHPPNAIPIASDEVQSCFLLVTIPVQTLRHPCFIAPLIASALAHISVLLHIILTSIPLNHTCHIARPNPSV